MIGNDTTTEAEGIQLAIHRRLGPEARFRIALEMSDTVRQLAETGIINRHPEYTKAQVRAALIHALYGIKRNNP